MYVDGGVRRGTDGLKALALGADLGFLRRPMIRGLTDTGAARVRDVVADVVHR